jgi:hypothetical protein
LLHCLGAPIIYAVLLPIALLDATVSLYQTICFRLWGLRRVARGSYFQFDRQKLAYLSPLQKLNCLYCGYANGVLAFVVEVASRTEQYWCPIQHAVPPRAPHKRYDGFAGYGDHEDLRARWPTLREELAKYDEP